MSNESPPLYIYLVERPDHLPPEEGFDWESMVVIAPNESKARYIHPEIDDGRTDKWNGFASDDDSWIDASDVVVTCIGIADDDQEKGLVLAKFCTVE